MKSRIISLTVLALSVCLLPQAAKAQVAASNPLEWTALAEGNDLINKQIEKQIKGQTQTALLQNTIAAEFNRIHKWEKQYNSYLKTVSGYASSLKACTHLYNDGVRIFLTLGKLCKAVRNNPQGIVASIGMNNLYIETATELVSVFTLLNDAVAKGGTENMLTGAERSKTLWALNDQLAAFSRKLHLLYLSIRYYTLNDMWNNVTAGMLDRDNGEVARMALSHWREGGCSRTIKMNGYEKNYLDKPIATMLWNQQGTGTERPGAFRHDSALHGKGREGTEEPGKGHADADHRPRVDKGRSGSHDRPATGDSTTTWTLSAPLSAMRHRSTDSTTKYRD